MQKFNGLIANLLYRSARIFTPLVGKFSRDGKESEEPILNSKEYKEKNISKKAGAHLSTAGCWVKGVKRGKGANFQATT